MSVKENISKVNYSLQTKIESFYNGGPIALTKCGSRLFTNFGTKVNCLDFKTGHVIFEISSPNIDDEITAFALSPCDEFLVVAYRNTLLVQFRLEKIAEKDANSTVNVERTWKSGHKAIVTKLAFSDDSQLMASGSADSTVKIWDLEAQFCTHTLKECPGCITALTFAPSHFFSDAAENNPESEAPIFLLYGDDTGKLFARDLNMELKITGALFPMTHHTSAVTGVVFGADFILTTGRDSIVAKVDAKKRKFKVEKMIPVFESMEAMVAGSLSPKEGSNETTVWTVGDSGCLKEWSIKTGTCLRTKQIAKNTVATVILTCDVIRCLLIATDEQTIVTVSMDDFSVKGKLIGRNDEIYESIFVGSNDQYAAVATNSIDIRLYDLATCQCQLLSDGHTNAVLSLDVAPFDRNLLASCSKDNNILLWRLDQIENPEILAEASGHAGPVTVVRFSKLKSSQSKFLVSAGDDRTLKVWMLKKPEMEIMKKDKRNHLVASATAVAHEKSVTALDVAPNDRFIATGSMDKQVKIWAIDFTKTSSVSLDLIATIKDHKRGIFDLKFSPIDQVLATASGDFTLKIFSLSDFTCLKTFEGHQSAVLRVNFVANGAQLVSADTAGVLRLWTIKTCECAQSIDAHEEKIYAMGLSSTTSDKNSGHRLLTGGADGRLSVWRDVGEQRRDEQSQEVAAKTADEQRLKNLKKQGKLTEALRLALKMARPFDAYNLLCGIIEKEPQSVASCLDQVMVSLRADHVALLLQYACDWNSNSRFFLVAQSVVAAILRVTHPDDLLKMPQIEKTVEALLPYSERHFDRLSRTRQNCNFVDYAWGKMRLDDQDSTSDFVKIKREV